MRPNQTGCFTTDRGDGSFDYNCDGKTDKCGEILDGSPCTTSTDCKSKVCLTYYKDADHDGYGVQASSIKRCGDDPIEGYISNNKSFDCYDSNNKVRPNQTECFDTDRGDGSFDYNCNGKQDKCVDCYSFSGGISTGTCAQNSKCQYGTHYEYRSLVNCGVTGKTSWAGSCYYTDTCSNKKEGTWYKPEANCTMSCN